MTVKLEHVATALGGLAVLVAGIATRSYFQHKVRLCDSGVGRLGQVFSSRIRSRCDLAHQISSLSVFVIVFGALTLAGGVAALLYGLVTEGRSATPEGAATDAP